MKFRDVEYSLKVIVSSFKVKSKNKNTVFVSNKSVKSICTFSQLSAAFLPYDISTEYGSFLGFSTIAELVWYYNNVML